MAKVVLTKSLLTSIADAIRAKTGKSAAMTPAQMATEIAAIQGEIPAFLVDNTAAYPENYVWPWATMRAYQLDTTKSPDDFFVNFDFGAVTNIPDYAMTVSTNGTKNGDKLRSVRATNAVTVGEYAFAGRSNLVTLDAPNIATIKGMAFAYTGLTSLDLRHVAQIDKFALSYSKLTALALDGIYTEIPAYVTQSASSLQRVDLMAQSLEKIWSNAFYYNSNLASLTIRRSDAVVVLAATDAFSGTKIKAGTGYIYVPASLVEEYKAATNWATYAAQIRAIS